MGWAASVLLWVLTPPAFAGGSLSFTASDFNLSSCPQAEVSSLGPLTLKAGWALTSTPVSARVFPAVAYDTASARALLFGGVNSEGSSFGDTWLWNGSSWAELSLSTAPSPRYGAGLAALGGRFLLFGGSGSNETWIFHVAGASWTRLEPAASPPPNLTHPALTYLPDQQKVILFGGGQGAGLWIFDMAASSWSLLNPSSPPQDRLGAGLVWDASGARAVLFGGRLPSGTSYLGDTWTLNPITWTWAEVPASTAPSARSDMGLAYDSHAAGVVLFGGRRPDSLSDAYFYKGTLGNWFEIVSSDNSNPPGRFGHGMAYDASSRRSFLVGGSASGSLVGSLWDLSWSSAAMCLSSSKTIVGATAIKWSTITVTGSVASGGKLEFQLAGSSVNVALGNYLGPSGSSTSWYNASSASLTVSQIHQGHRYLKVKTSFEAAHPAARPGLSLIRIDYNQAPSAPALQEPANGLRVKSLSANLSWQPAADQDGLGDLPLSYELQVASEAGFANPFLEQTSISSTSYSALLGDGLQYWRVRARDREGLSGEWSSYSFLIDTHTPPSPVHQLTAQKGPGNKAVSLSWVFPGPEMVSGGRYLIRFSSAGPISNETLWPAAAEQSGLLSAASGQVILSTVTGLSDATTYYFAVKTEDELSNRSALSLSSPYTMTNASPTATYLGPVGSAALTGKVPVTWQTYDPNIADELRVALTVKRDSDSSWSVAIASGLSGGTYLWDSRSLKNGADYRLLVEVQDSDGYRAQALSPSSLKLDNVNEAPVIIFSSAPASGARIERDIVLIWQVTDPNSYQSHRFNVGLSANSGSSYDYVAAYDLAVSSLVLDVHSFGVRWGLGNLATYRIKVVVTDSGNPELSSEAVTPVFEAVVNPASPLTLTGPLETDFPSPFDLEFSWKPPASLDEPLTYSLLYSTQTDLANASAQSGLAAVSSRPAAGSLTLDQTYYWQVRAKDSQGREVRSQVARFFLWRFKAKTKDRRLLVEAVSGMPAGGIIAFEDARQSLGSLVAAADQQALGDRLIGLLSQPVWHVQAWDVQGRALEAPDAALRVAFSYEGSGLVRPLVSGIDASQLKIARLDQSAGRWELAPRAQDLNVSNKEVSASNMGFGVVTLVGALSSEDGLSAVTNFPNPFNPHEGPTAIRYALNQNATVRIRLYTILGDLVRVLSFDWGAGGGTGTSNGYTNEVFWDGKNGRGEVVANGMYIAQIEADFSTRKTVKTRSIGVLK